MKIEEIYQLFQQYPTITTDTRNCQKDSLFFALKGTNFNGNTFAEQALKEGCAYAFVDEPEYKTNDKIILVNDCLSTLQDLSRHHRRILSTPIIAITGTNGKTTTKELLSAVLSTQYNVLFTQGNLNNHIGVPLTLLKLTKEHEFAVIEMGANHPGEIKILAEIAEPDYGLITNVGKAHMEGFGSFENIIKTKGELYDYIRNHGGKIFILNRNTYLEEIATGISKVYYGKERGSFIWGTITDNSLMLKIEWHNGNEMYPVSTQLIGAYNIDNVLAAIAIGNFFGVTPQNICEAIESYQPNNYRSQLKETGKNHLIIDAYNANPSSMIAALENFRSMDVSPKMVILGDMLELGDNKIKEHNKIFDLIRHGNFSKVFLCGESFSQVANGYYHTYLQTEDLINDLKKENLQGYYILIKGSRGIQLEKVTDFL